MSSNQIIEAEPLPVSEVIRSRIENAGARYFASDNIADFIQEGEREQLIEEVAGAFSGVLNSLVIDTKNDHNSTDTPHRLAKMYVNELMGGRYYPAPNCTAFPNVGPESFHGMLVARAEIRSMCSHHHQPVKGICYIGILPTDKVIGLSKYTRIAQWCARRGTLQEELTDQILKEIQEQTGTKDVAVHIHATHGCMENRGVESHSSLTQTTSLSGQFFNDAVKKEFFDNVNNQILLNRDHS
jgi:GTP cyclohydrolase I